MNDWAKLHPYVPGRQENLLEQCERLKREFQDTARRLKYGAANDNQPERKPMWWERD